MNEHQDDDTIISRVLGGDMDAYAVIIERYRGDVLRIVSGHVPQPEAAAVAHDAFVRAYRSLSRYKPTRPFVRWLATIAVRTCHDFWRSRYRNRETVVSDLSEGCRLHLEASMASTDPDPAQAASQNERVARLHQALDSLSPPERLVVTLVHLEEHSTKETAQLMGISVANVKIRAFRARKKLKVALDSLEPQGGGAK